MDTSPNFKETQVLFLQGYSHIQRYTTHFSGAYRRRWRKVVNICESYSACQKRIEFYNFYNNLMVDETKFTSDCLFNGHNDYYWVNKNPNFKKESRHQVHQLDPARLRYIVL